MRAAARAHGAWTVSLLPTVISARAPRVGAEPATGTEIASLAGTADSKATEDSEVGEWTCDEILAQMKNAVYLSKSFICHLSRI